MGQEYDLTDVGGNVAYSTEDQLEVKTKEFNKYMYICMVYDVLFGVLTLLSLLGARDAKTVLMSGTQLAIISTLLFAGFKGRTHKGWMIAYVVIRLLQLGYVGLTFLAIAAIFVLIFLFVVLVGVLFGTSVQEAGNVTVDEMAQSGFDFPQMIAEYYDVETTGTGLGQDATDFFVEMGTLGVILVLLITLFACCCCGLWCVYLVSMVGVVVKGIQIISLLSQLEREGGSRDIEMHNQPSVYPSEYDAHPAGEFAPQPLADEDDYPTKPGQF